MTFDVEKIHWVIWSLLMLCCGFNLTGLVIVILACELSKQNKDTNQ